MKNKKRYSIRIQMMGINISITMVTFLLYGALFIWSLSLLIGKYINNDLDFLLTEISDNLGEKYEYMEQMIQEVRDSEVLMDYLKSEERGEKREEMNEVFSREIEISDSKNQRAEGKPFVDKVYLFRDDGEYVSDFYYTIASSEGRKSDQIVKNVWESYKESCAKENGFSTFFHEQEDSLYMACPILDDKMEKNGTIIFDVNLETVRSILDEINNYQDAFWILYDDGKQVLEEAAQEVMLHDFDALNQEYEKPYRYDVQGSEYRIYQEKLGLDTWVIMGIPENHAFLILYDSLGIFIFMLFLILLIGIVSFSIFTYKITKPVEEVTEKLKKVQEGDFETKLPDYDNKEFYEISNGFNMMTSEINHLITEVYEKQLLLKEQELKFLQSQLNPHFIFNVLNSIALQSKLDGNTDVSKTISTFSQLIQAKIYRSDKEKVQIRQELEYVKYYLEIQKFRYGDKLTYSVEIDESLLGYYIQKLCIQLIVENAVIHGLEPKMTNGKVSIRGYEEAGDIIFEIEDDGVGFELDGDVNLPLENTKADSKHNQVGLNNINAILQLRYGKEYGLSIYSKKDQGTKVTIRVPFDDGRE